MIETISNLYYEYYNDLNFINTILIIFIVSTLFNIILFLTELKNFSIYTTILPLIHTIVSLIMSLVITIILDKTITPYFNLNYTANVLYLVLCYLFYMIFGIVNIIKSERVGVFKFFDLLFDYAEYKINHKSSIKKWNYNYNLNINYINNFLK